MNREKKLKTDFNTFITSKFNLAEKDFYNELSTKDFLELKNLLSNINNIITLKLTIQFIAEITGYYNFSSQNLWLFKENRSSLMKKNLCIYRSFS